MNGISRPTLMRATLAFSALILGMAVYYLDRQPERVYFLAHWVSSAGETGSFFGDIGNHLPTAIHVFAFILLTAVIVAPSRRFAAAICVAWLGIDSLFEIGQIPVIAQGIASRVPDWFHGVPFVENTSEYFLSGTFDVLDLGAIAAGALAAFLTLVLTASKEIKNALDIQFQ